MKHCAQFSMHAQCVISVIAEHWLMWTETVERDLCLMWSWFNSTHWHYYSISALGMSESQVVFIISAPAGDECCTVALIIIMCRHAQMCVCVCARARTRVWFCEHACVAESDILTVCDVYFVWRNLISSDVMLKLYIHTCIQFINLVSFWFDQELSLDNYKLIVFKF